MDNYKKDLDNKIILSSRLPSLLIFITYNNSGKENEVGDVEEIKDEGGNK